MITLLIAQLLCAPFFFGLNQGSSACGTPTVPSNRILTESFEGANGYDNAGWVPGGTGSIDPDYTTTILDGSQSLLITIPNAGLEYAYFNTAGTAEVWAFFLARFSTVSPASATTFFDLANTGGGSTCVLKLNTDGTVLVTSGAQGVSTVSALTANTKYWFWVHYKAGSGANGVEDVGFSTDCIRPASGNQFAQRSDTVQTASIGYVIPGNFVAGASAVNVIYDRLYLTSSQIGDNP